MYLKIKHLISNYWILLSFIAIKFFLQYLLVNPVYELHRDEFLHLDQANHLALGYISVPPLTSWISKIIFLLGGGLFWIRFFPALFGVLTIVFAWLIVEELDGKLLSKVVVSAALTFSVLIRLNILFQPNSFDILAWTIIFYLLIRYIKSNDPRWLYFLAVIVALGLYNKYNLIFLLTGLLVGFLFTYQRKLLTIFSVWKALMLAIILILPNLLWQIDHHFPVINHMKVLKENQLDNNSIKGFLTGQLLFFMSSLPLIVGALIAYIIYKPFRPYRFIGICFLTVITLFSFLKAKDYYAIGLYPVLIASGTVFLEKTVSRKWKLTILSLLMVCNLAFFMATARLVYPLLSPAEIIKNKAVFEKTGMLRWEDGKNHLLPQDFADMLGWQEMADKAFAAYKTIPQDELLNTLIFCDNYGQTGALNYYNRGKMKEAYSFNTDYIYWLPRLKTIQNILLVGDKPDDDIIRMFEYCELIGTVENEFAREKNTSIYLLRGANSSVTESFYKMADERKNNLDIF